MLSVSKNVDREFYANVLNVSTSQDSLNTRYVLIGYFTFDEDTGESETDYKVGFRIDEEMEDFSRDIKEGFEGFDTSEYGDTFEHQVTSALGSKFSEKAFLEEDIEKKVTFEEIEEDKINKVKSYKRKNILVNIILYSLSAIALGGFIFIFFYVLGIL